MKQVVDWLNWYRDMGVEMIATKGLVYEEINFCHFDERSEEKSSLEIQELKISRYARNDNTEIYSQTLTAVREELGDCQRCKLCATRTNIVFGSGNEKATLMFVGEGPGADEDLQGLPFVGKAGELLTKMISAMGLSREDVYIANIVKCRPPNNRPPEEDEIAPCLPFLKKQIEAIAPKIICALGTFAAQTLLSTKTRIADLRGKFYDFRCNDTCDAIKVMPTFHPAYLLRNPSEKKKAWEDLKKIMKEINPS